MTTTIMQCFIVLSKRHSATWILEGDIRACFDRISHPWMLANIPMDKTMLDKWLTMGYIEKRVFYPTKEGTVQGGTISPTLANLALSGLERAVKSAVSKRDKVNVVVYADDFIITGASREVLEGKVKPVVVDFLGKRGLELSEEKTQISHIGDGFDFLGLNVRKYREKLIIKPARKGVHAFLGRVRNLIKSNPTVKTENLIRQLNPMIRGWANQFRHAASKKTFVYVDDCIFRALLKWIRRRHPDKNADWMRKKYFRRQGLRNWIFFARVQDKEGKTLLLDLFKAVRVPIKRHVKIKGAATPYDPAFRDYFERRHRLKRSPHLNTDVSEALPIF